MTVTEGHVREIYTRYGDRLGQGAKVDVPPPVVASKGIGINSININALVDMLAKDGFSFFYDQQKTLHRILHVEHLKQDRIEEMCK